MASAAQAAAYRAAGGQGDVPEGYRADLRGNNDPNAGLIPNVSDIKQQYQDAVKPALESLQSSVPEIQKTYATQQQQLQTSKQTLNDRYKQILSDIGNRQTADVNAQTRVTAGEFGKRGIPLTSTAAQQGIQSAVQPINANYANLATQAGISNQDSINQLDFTGANLTNQETSTLRDVYNKMGELQANAGQQGIAGALQQYQLQLQAQQQAAAQALAQAQLATTQKQNEFENQLASNQFNQIALPTSQANIKNILSEISTRGLQYAAPGQALAFLSNIFGGNQQGQANNQQSPYASYGAPATSSNNYLYSK